LSLCRHDGDHNGINPVPYEKSILWVAIPLSFVALMAVTGCKKQNVAETPEIRPVRSVVATPQASGEAVVLTGYIAAENEASLGFRIAGRLTERLVNIGDKVETGQVLAKLDPEDELNALRSTQATLAAAQAQQRNASATFDRQRELLASGHTPRAVRSGAARTEGRRSSGRRDRSTG
jgi:multidrug efflux pump subunit AcrA (membrane-fusion protein)